MRLFDNRWNGAHGIGRFSSELFRRLSGYHAVDVSGHPSDPSDPLRLGYYLRKVHPELYLSPGYNAPIRQTCPVVFTIHDLNHLFVRENSSLLKRLYYDRILRPAVHRAAALFTVSEFSRQQILEWSGVSEHRVVTIQQGIADEFRASGERYVTARPYILFVGNHRPHKNLTRVFRSFAMTRLERDFDFLATGVPDERLRAILSELNISGRVRFLGKIPDNTLAAVYRGATALVLVSLYEGFGLPILESMACGTPVLTSNVASMPEVSGGAALLADPCSIDDIAEKMEMITLNETIRTKLIARGLGHVTTYQWNAAAEKVEGVISHLLPNTASRS